MLKKWWLWERRRWRLSEMRLLFMAILVSVVVVTAVGFFTDRVDRLMRQQAVALMGGDLVLNSTRPIGQAYQQYATEQAITSASMTKFVSMTSTDDEFKMAQIKAVTPNYPLKGEIRLKSEDASKLYRVSETAPSEGEVWIEAALLRALKLQVGDNLQLGSQSFAITEVLVQEPDRGSSFLQLAPVVLMNQADVEKTGLLSAGSRARFSQYFAGDETSIEQLQIWLKPQLQTGESIRSLNDGLPTVQQALQRATRFLSLAALLSVVLAGAAIALTSASLVRRETNQVAVLKALGQTRSSIIQYQSFSFLFLAIVGAIAGAVIGFVLQFVLADRLASIINETLPPAGLQPIILGFSTAILLLLGFALPHVMQLTQTPPIQIFRQQILATSNKRWLWQAATLVPSLYILFYLQANDAGLAAILLAGLTVGMVIFWLISRWVLQALARLSLSVPQLAVFRGARRSVLLLMVFAVGFFSLLLLTTIRTDLLDRWQATLPDNAPNHFLVNIQPHEKPEVEKLLQQNDIQGEFFPMIRGRLTAINGTPISAEDYEAPEAKNLLRREFNLSSFSEFPSSNVLLEGEWFTPESTTGFSIEEHVGERLGFGLGDKLTFDVAGQVFEQEVTSVRDVNWESMKPNFYVIAAPKLLASQTHTYITSVYIDPQNKQLLPDLLKQWPSVTAIDVTVILQQVRDLIDRATFAVQGIFFFTLVAGIVVLIAALQSQQPERRREMAILKSLGATRAQLRRRILLEFSTLGGLAGILAGLLASSLGAGIAYFLFDLSGGLNPYPVLIGGILGALLVGLTAYLNLSRLLNIMPVQLFKAS